jgi:hypothetical protein
MGPHTLAVSSKRLTNFRVCFVYFNVVDTFSIPDFKGSTNLVTYFSGYSWHGNCTCRCY